MNNLLLIISREYVTRVKKKGFIFTTLLMPIVMVALSVAPALIADMNHGTQSVAVVDRTERLVAGLAKETTLPLIFPDEPADSVLADPAYKTILVIGPDAIEDPSDITLYNRDAESLETTAAIERTLERAIEDVRLHDLGQENLREILAGVEASVHITSLNLDDNGETESSDAIVSFLIGLAMSFILYMFIIIYGQMVMLSIIEEKNNRVLEILVTSVKPTQLMMGKLIGVGAVAVTQVAIWIGIIASFSAFLLPSLANPEIMETVSLLNSLSYIFSIGGYLLIFLVGGFLLYASIYAAIGAAVDNIQDASQLQTFAMVPVIVALIFAVSVAQNPNSAVAVWLSIIPFTSPMVMMTRIPAGVPGWEILLSVVLLYATTLFLIWFSAKIYRVGIFMYGKKPNVKELIRWARYK